MAGFLYGQTEYNMLENALHLKDYVNYAKNYGYTSLSITDSNLYAHKKFIKLCNSLSIKPIVGLELIIDDITILLYPFSDLGYKNLMKISSMKSFQDIIKIEDLKQYMDDIYFVINTKDIDIYLKYKSIFTYTAIGIFPRDSYKDIYEFALKKNEMILPLLNTLYLNKEDKIVYETLLKISKEKVIDGDNYLKTLDEVKDLFKDFDKVFYWYDLFINSINVSFKVSVSLAKFKNKKDILSKEYLKELAYLGLQKRLKDYKGDKEVYQKRLDYELSVIDKMGFNDYILIVWDFIRYAKKSGILVGPGRGSGAGSLVNYAIGITSIDPLKYNLLFERFLNVERITMPDIDTDFPDDKRAEVITYVKNLYGKNHVCNITTFGTFQAKSSLRELAKVLKIDQSKINSVTALLNSGSSISDILENVDKESDLYNLIYIASKMENLPRNISTHAAGIILSNEDLFDIIPMQKGINDMYQASLEASDLEEMGLLKIDFLGLRNLNIIDNIISMIPNFNNINIYEIPLDDFKTYEMLSGGDTLGVFQLESKGIIEFIKKLKPSKFEDLVALLALYRPGPMDNIDEYSLRKHGKAFSYITKELEPILKETYGIIVYQEQIMQIALNIAGYTLASADILRRAVSKKKEDVLIEEREKFVKASINRGFSEDISNKIYDDIVKFASYGFNKSHSVSYALLSYVMAYLKNHYPLIFITSILNNSIGDLKNTKEYILYAKKRGIIVSPPNINISTNKYVIKDNVIYMPLTSIKGIGFNSTNEIILKRDNNIFLNIDDFNKRVNISEDIFSALVFSNAFDTFGETKKTLMTKGSSVKGIINKYLEDRLLTTDEYKKSILREKELYYLGINLKYNIYDDILKLNNKYKINNLFNIKVNDTIKTFVLFTDTKEIYTKNKDLMLLGSITNGKDIINAVIFPRVYKTIDKIKEGILYLIEGNITYNDKFKRIETIINKLKEVGDL